MNVLIFHSTEELLLKQFQKELITHLHSQNVIFCHTSPLWIDLPQLDSKHIQSVQIMEPEYNKTTKNVYLPVVVKTVENNFNLQLPFLIWVSGEFTKDCSLKTKGSQELFPMNLKIFRTGEKNIISNNTFSISNSRWIKLSR